MRYERPLKIAVCLIFVVAIGVVFLSTILFFGTRNTDNMKAAVDENDLAGQEAPDDTFNRYGEKQIAVPDFNFSFEYLNQLGNYLNQNFGLRRSLVYLNALADVDVFKSSPNKKVIMGKDGWLYLSDFVLGKKVDVLQLESLAGKIADLQAILSDKGIQFLLVLVPDKESVYPEMAPSNLGSFIDKYYSSFTNLLHDAGVYFVDLKPLLLAAKEDLLIYSADDTHWNQYGAFLGFKEIMSFFDIPTPEIEGISTYEREADLKRMAGLSGSEEANTVVLDSNFKPDKYGNILFYGDSFGGGFTKYLKDYFNKVTVKHVIGDKLFGIFESNLKGVDYVVVEMVERNIPELASMFP